MKSGGKTLYFVGAIPIVAVLIWARVGYYTSSVPVMVILVGAGIALMVIGSRINKGKEPNKAVAWTPPAATTEAPPLPLAVTTEAPPPPAVAPLAPLVPPPAAPAAPLAHPVLMPWALVTADGSRHQLAARTVLGRNPDATDGDLAIALADAGASVSKAHALVTVDGEQVLVRDLGSTNGTFVVGLQGEETECTMDSDAVIPTGGTLELGEYALSLVRSSA